MDVMGLEEAQGQKIEFFLTIAPQVLEKLASHGVIWPTLNKRWVPEVSFICFQSRQLEKMLVSETKGIH